MDMRFPRGSYGYIADKNKATADKLLKELDWDVAVFFMQQAIEKYLKQYLVNNEMGTEKLLATHSLLTLCEAACIDKLRRFYNDLDVIENAYSNGSYPSAVFVEFTAEEAVRLYDSFRQVCRIMNECLLSTQ